MSAPAAVRNTRYYYWVTLPGYGREVPVLKGVGHAHISPAEAVERAGRIVAARAAQ